MSAVDRFLSSDGSLWDVPSELGRSPGGSPQYRSAGTRVESPAAPGNAELEKGSLSSENPQPAGQGVPEASAGEATPGVTPSRAPREGWGWPGLARKAHYFADGDVISLCRKWMYSGPLTRNQEGSSPDDCVVCRRELERRNG